MAGAATKIDWSDLADDDALPKTDPKWDSNAAHLVVWRHSAVERGEALAMEVFTANVGVAAGQGNDSAGYGKTVSALAQVGEAGCHSRLRGYFF